MKVKQTILLVVCAALLAAAVGVPTVLITNATAARKLPVYCVDTEERKVALSFDAAWGNEDTQEILDILAKHNVHVTFFMTGGWVVRWAYMKYCVKSMFYRGQAEEQKEVLKAEQ